ncbi:uncharacterized protein F5Z01DRAFT_737917 [Emericellopsis atlantica]|uniref:Uncharacterized protein n=1 Tax=Emericellopsis atlantica TaxID=2614577 RepID=A0A9P7ZK78_9HYPO|nr:uncharacterized protein F5Z01DRAFT_737917 [Emericellopsis atlantica]KAG9253130.1 hypothetical protein F5Z01DRAFT_737917 [Emericellopsis atlantica]
MRLPLFLTISALAPLVLGAAIEPRQQDGQVYCDRGDDELNVDDCRGAADMVNTASGYYREIAQFRYGNCIIDITSRLGIVNSISGQLYKDSILSVLDTCEGPGYIYQRANEVKVYRCEICSYGVCAECNDPGQGPLKRDVAEIEASSQIQKRQDSPEPGLSCGGWNPAVDADNCRDAADELDAQGGNVELPFRENVAGCNIAAEQKKPNLYMPRSQIAAILRHGTDLCESGGYIGMISDTQNSLVDVFYGKICGKFGFGNGGCTP